MVHSRDALFVMNGDLLLEFADMELFQKLSCFRRLEDVEARICPVTRQTKTEKSISCDSSSIKHTAPNLVILHSYLAFSARPSFVPRSGSVVPIVAVSLHS